MKIWINTLLLLSFTLGSAIVVTAQEETPSATEEQQQKAAAEKEKRAFALLDQVVNEAQLLKLPENRARVQIGAADLLWQRNQGRARSLFTLAADNVAEMMRTLNANPAPESRRGINQGRGAAQLRQELVLTAARYDAPLAYQLLAATRTTTAATSGNLPFPDSEESLEQRLVAQIAALDPKLALQNAEQMLDKGQYPRSLLEVLSRLQAKDKEAAAKLEEKLVKRLQSTNMLSTFDAATLAVSLLRSGPRPAENPMDDALKAAASSSQVLGQASFIGLMGSVIDAALKAMPPPPNTQRNVNNVRNRRNFPGGGGAGLNNATNQPTDAEVEQGNARRLLSSLQMLLPQIDQHLPARSQAVRQKIGELGMGNNPRANAGQVFRDLQQGTSASLMAAAPLAPPALQSRIYQQAALRALDEGDAERARQIANDHLDEPTRNSVLQAVEFRQTSEKIDGNKLEEVRRTLSGLRSDNERIDLLLQLSGSVQKDNPKLALQFLDEARQITNRRASNYQQFEQQLRVAEAFKDLEPARGFEVLEPGIAQLNELLSAAATLSGFEVNVFQDGELPLEGRNGLSSMVSRYGAVLGLLAANDFDQSQSLANRFQLAEPRIVAKLSIVRGMLGREPVGRARNSRFGPNAFIRRPGQ